MFHAKQGALVRYLAYGKTYCGPDITDLKKGVYF